MTSHPRQPAARLITPIASRDLPRGGPATAALADAETAAVVPRRAPFSLRSAGPNRPRWLPYTVVTDRVRPSYLGFSDAESLARFLRIRATIPG